MSNQDEGVVIIFGVDENDKYKIKGVYDSQDLQKKVTEQCKQMEPMSEYEVYSYKAFRKRIRDDIRTVDEAKLQLLDEKRLNDYLTMVKQERRNLSENVSNEEILELMAVTACNVPTLAGIMTLSKYPQTYFPQLCITAVCLLGTEMGTVGESGERFIDNKRITGAIPDMLEEAVEFVRKNSRNKTIRDHNGKRKDKPEYLIKAVREVILNALVHCDYSLHTENTPIRIEMYRDRMEVIKSGGLYGKISIDVLGKVDPETRNAALANMLELLKITENRYSGIPTIRSELIQAGLPVPIFSVVHGEFKVVMKNDCYKENTTSEKAILDFCSIPRSRTELIEFTGKSRTYTMINLVAPLVSAGKLKMTLPDKPKSSKQRYIKA